MEVLSLPVTLLVTSQTEDGGGSGTDGGGFGFGLFSCGLDGFSEFSDVMEDFNTHDNSEFIYEYTESSIEQIHKSIDIVTGKLTTVIGFSGVLLKFAADMPDNDFQFLLKVGVSLSLILAIAFCGTGLTPQSRGPVVSPEFLLEPEQYRTTDEKIRLIIIKQWLKSAPILMDVRDQRITLLKYAIGMLIFAGCLFGISNILSSIH